MKASVFLGLLVKQPNFREAQVLEQLNADAVVAGVGLVAQGQVGFDRVQALVLQGVGLDLFDQADAAAFLRQIDQHAGPFVGRSSRRAMCSWSPQSQRSDAEQVAGEAGRVQPHQRRGPTCQARPSRARAAAALRTSRRRR